MTTAPKATAKPGAADAKKYPTIVAHKSKQPWEWLKGSDGERVRRALLKPATM